MELGFEVQVTVAFSDGTTPWVQLSRNEFKRLDMKVGVIGIGARARLTSTFERDGVQ